MSIHKYIYGFKTKHKEGFTSSEIDEVLSHFNITDIEKFNKIMGCNTCMVIDEQIITYHCDVELAVTCYLQNRKPKSWEWD